MTNYHATSKGSVPFTAEEETVWASEQAAWSTGSNERKAAEVREKRNARIEACDWRMLTDSPASAEWKVYRQALRDVPQQAGFPDAVVWPVAP